METRATILSELQELSPLVAGISRANPYRLPEGYFEALPGEILHITQAEQPELGSRQPVFSVPQGYFDNLAANVLARVKEQELTVQQELEELAPLLNTISKKPVYRVPEGYFESLELTIPLKLGKPSASVFHFSRSTKRVLQYAVAACTAAVLMFGAYMYSNQESQVISYREAKTMNLSEELSGLREEDINIYLNETPVVGYAVNTGGEDIDVEQILEVTTDQEITEYLEETSMPGDKIKDS